MFSLHQACVPALDFEATVDFYRLILKLDGARVSAREHLFESGGARLSCVRMGGHECAHQPTALVLGADRLPTAKEIQAAGGRTDARRPLFELPEGAGAALATDPSGNTICFVLQKP